VSLKVTSDPIAVSFELSESAPNTFTQEQIALQLDILNNEVALVYAVDLDLESPDALAGIDTRVTASLTSTSQTGTVGLGNSNCLAQGRKDIRAGGFVDGGVGFTRAADSTPVGQVEYIGIISTNNFFVSITGANNAAPKTLSGRIWLSRARADAATYAALVQSEVLSA
tara:strand:+ start:527 stop:1033 length:507 start_codon:yes stop_codon:yes gene_type:complete